MSAYPDYDGDYQADAAAVRRALAAARPVPGESEYVVRSLTLPDRRLDFTHQRIWSRLYAYVWAPTDEERELEHLLAPLVQVGCKP